jgi:protein-tyrosine phosphatase
MSDMANLQDGGCGPRRRGAAFTPDFAQVRTGRGAVATPHPRASSRRPRRATIQHMPNHPHRVWPLQGASNFRDLGGYPGHGGRRVRWRRLFRSEHLGGLTATDHATLAALGLARVFDFRGVEERAATPNNLPSAQEHSLAIEPTVVQRMDALQEAGQPVTAEVMVSLMQELYRGLVGPQAHRYQALFGHLLASDAPLVFHCTAGKDRTGVAAALILLALGVPMDIVREDFLLTNRHYRRPVQAVTGAPADVLAVMWQVQASFLDAALEVVDRDHGGMDRYLRVQLGLSEAALVALRDRYLGPADAAPAPGHPAGLPPEPR